MRSILLVALAACGGAGWFCNTPTSGSQVGLAGSCFRDEKVCKNAVAESTRVYGPCTGQRTAFCHTSLFVPTNAPEVGGMLLSSAVCSPTRYGCERVANHWANAEGTDPRTVSTCAEWD